LITIEKTLDQPARAPTPRRHARPGGDVTVAMVAKLGAPAEQPARRRVGWPTDLVAHTDRLMRRADADGQIEQRRRRLGEAKQTAAAAGEDDAAGQKAVVAAAPHLEANHLQDLARPRGDDLGQV